MSGNQQTPKTSLSLYANLLEGGNASTISGAPVSYTQPAEAGSEQDEAVKKQQALAASLRFQPTKRPQLAAQKAKAKAIASKLAGRSIAPAPSSSTEQSEHSSSHVSSSEPPALPNVTKTTAADWTATVSEDEDTHAHFASNRQNRKKRKKNKEPEQIYQDWDDIYDPSRPNNYEEYKHSEEKIREVREWKDLLYRHRTDKRMSSDSDSGGSQNHQFPRQFAPPASMSFAPPNFDDENDVAPYEPPPPPPLDIPNDASGDDAFLRRQRMSQTQAALDPSVPFSPPPPPPPPPTETGQPTPGSISRAPVRYNLPAPPAELPATEAELQARIEAEEQPEDSGVPEPRTNRPGQKGFAERLMSKYGWSKGQGLGAQGTGITTALYAKVDKRKKKSDAEGGGFVTPTTTGKIMGGARSKEAEAEMASKFGAMSEVVRLAGMLDGMDVRAELARTDTEGGGLMQEIGEECGEKYGSVERVYIHVADDASQPLVFVKFVSQLSALRAVNALEGRIFGGNTIRARFWDREQFEGEVYV